MNRRVNTLIPWIDLTSLNGTDTKETIKKLCERASTPYGNVAAVCIYPQFVAYAVALLEKESIAVATVVNFPDGDDTLHYCISSIGQAIAVGVREIDVVLPYKRYLMGEHGDVLEFIQSCRGMCGKDILLKVILETGALTNHDIIADTAELAIKGGADFIKTSTGKIKAGTTLGAARAILEVIKEHKDKKIGFKVSGGVRTLADAMGYADLVAEILGEQWLKPETFRIGASQLLDAILNSS